MKGEKGQLGRARVTYLGYKMGQGTRELIDAKVAAIRDFPRPRTKKDNSLADSLRQQEPDMVVWTVPMERTFPNLKEALISRPVLASPDYSREFVLQYDANHRALGVVLSQVDQRGDENTVLYLNRKLTPPEEAYSMS